MTVVTVVRLRAASFALHAASVSRPSPSTRMRIGMPCMSRWSVFLAFLPVRKALKLIRFTLLQADEAYYIGPAPSTESYLRKQAYVDICRKSGAQAVHPGYG